MVNRDINYSFFTNNKNMKKIIYLAMFLVLISFAYSISLPQSDITFCSGTGNEVSNNLIDYTYLNLNGSTAGFTCSVMTATTDTGTLRFSWGSSDVECGYNFTTPITSGIAMFAYDQKMNDCTGNTRFMIGDNWQSISANPYGNSMCFYTTAGNENFTYWDTSEHFATVCYDNTWFNFTMVINVSESPIKYDLYMYNTGTLVWDKIISNVQGRVVDTVNSLDGFWAYGSGTNTLYVDNIRIFNSANCPGGISHDSVASFINYTPPDSYINNTVGQNITVSCTENGNARIFFDTVNPPIREVVTSLTSQASWLVNRSIVNTSTTFYFKGNCSNATSSATAVRTFTFDNVTPTQTINPNNFFKSNNITNVSNYGTNNLRINLSIFDDRDLYAFMINITLKNGTSIFSYTNSSLTGKLSYNFSNNFTLLGYDANQLIGIETKRSDSHTAIKIDEYKNKRIVNGLEFNTAEGNKVIIESEDIAEFTAIREIDKYSIDINFKDGLDKKRTLYLTSDHKINYLSDSQYLGHFIIFNSWEMGGNWLDLLGADTTVTVTKLTDYTYKIIFDKLKANTKLRSIGGLNIGNNNYKWYFGNYTSFYTPNPALSDFSSTIYFNISKGGEITDIGACLYWNETYHCDLTKAVYTDYIIFYKTMPSIEILSDTTYGYLFNVSVTQSDSSKYYFNTSSYNYNIKSWFFDDCTVANITGFYLNTYSEKTGLPHIVNATISLKYYLLGSSDKSKDYQVNLYNNNSFKICKSVEQDLYGDLVGILEGVDIGSRTYNQFAILLNNSFSAYVLPTTGATNYITFRVQNQGGESISDAIMDIYRSVNASNTLIYTGSTDFAGQIVVYLDQLYRYSFVINASGYPIKSFDLQPSDTSYTLTLTQLTQTLYNNLYSGIKFRVSPISTLMNVTNLYQNITFEVVGNVQEIGIELTNHNYSCLPVNCTDTLNGAGIVTVGIKANFTGVFSTAFYFVPYGSTERVYVNDGLIKVVPFIFKATRSLINLMIDIRDNTSPNMRSIIAVVITLIFIGLGASLGLYGALLLVPGTLATIFLSLPQIAFINPTLGIFLVIFGFFSYVGLSMRQ